MQRGNFWMPVLQLDELLPRMLEWQLPDCPEQVLGLSGELQPMQPYPVPQLSSWLLPQCKYLHKMQRELFRLLGFCSLLQLQCGLLS